MVGVRGLTLFGQHFSRYRDQYVLIGGVASSLVMDEAGVSFRTTKDLDIVLVIEALDSQFVAAFWAFVHSGGYQIRQASTARPVFYRFQNPTDETYPAQLELFSRTPDEFDHPEHATLTPIPTDESVSSLSAIPPSIASEINAIPVGAGLPRDGPQSGPVIAGPNSGHVPLSLSASRTARWPTG
ncbi:hypothetical protein [Pseudomonas sp. DrBHI1]|uniref:hypothetical protein n=1 Tax=Pseudomonas sp. DrBHI1 TaxID=2006091 RepID=UPI0015ADFA64|nr:hypothetical protein [Pseudomonas sp. DrBHI1]